MKYLLIGALLAFVFLLIYSRLRPYIELFRKVSGTMKGTLGATTQPIKSTGSDKRLMRCVACGTWVPASRAVGPARSSYCSTECLEKSGSAKERKLAG